MSLDPQSPKSARPALRQGRAIGWIEHALEPVRQRHPRIDLRELAIAIRSATGVETLIWLVDIAGYTRSRAAETARQTAQALLAAAIAADRGPRRS